MFQLQVLFNFIIHFVIENCLAVITVSFFTLEYKLNETNRLVVRYWLSFKKHSLQYYNSGDSDICLYNIYKYKEARTKQEDKQRLVSIIYA